MILFQGKILDDKEQTHILDILEDKCKKTLARHGRLTADMVINACDVLYKRVISGEFDDVVRPLISALSISHERFMEMAELFSQIMMSGHHSFEAMPYMVKREMINITISVLA